MTNLCIVTGLLENYNELAPTKLLPSEGCEFLSAGGSEFLSSQVCGEDIILWESRALEERGSKCH